MNFWIPESVGQDLLKKASASNEDGAIYATALESKLREYGVGMADLELARDDVGWMKLGFSEQDSMFDTNRVETVRRARAYYYRDPLSKQAIRLWTDYALGRGINWKAKEDNAREVLHEFWNAPVNEPILSNQGQTKSSDKVLTDGEIFFVFFMGAGPVKIRRIDPLEITEIITDPDDIETKKLYKREWTTRQGKSNTKYYRDWANEDKDGEWPDMSGGMQSATADGIVYHVPFRTLGLRGVSLLFGGMDWSKAHRKFLEARASITQAMARFAWKAKIKGTPAQVSAERSRWQSTLATTGQETNPPPAPGATFVENEGYDLTPIKTETGAGAAKIDANMLLQMFGTAVGIFPHYFGAGEAFRLATATAMERPMRVQFEAYQQLWADVYDNIFDFVMADANIPEKDRFVDIDFPPIVEKDANEKIKSILEIVQVMPDLDVVEMRKLILTSLGINNPDEVLGNIKPLEAASSKLIKVVKELRESLLKEGSNGNGHREVSAV